MSRETGQDSTVQKDRTQSAWRKWGPLAGALVFAALVLGWEYREFLLPLILSPASLLFACLAMHFLMHRGHGGRRGGHRAAEKQENDGESADGAGGPS
ncbi:DUF2933 domain-containing protein [Leisingera caerulea]|uniref:DUF2933 domain-containing protein n=1 Tax=Leisingera caerulea TaxID=506591 RepID=A0ABY5WUI9_LEICA|nr:DUF2933 domain-containing protein [Leisingera caerulea]